MASEAGSAAVVGTAAGGGGGGGGGVDSLVRRFFAVDPRQLLEDVYNAGDDLACDGLDEFERVLLHTYAPSASALAAAPAAAASSAAAPAAAASALAAEIRAGTDALSEALLDAHVRPGDKFEVYCLMELFGLHGELRDDVEAMLAERGDRAQLAPGARVYTEAEQAALEQDLARLEEAAKRQRRRARTLMRLHNLYERRVPEAEEADKRLGELLEQFQRRSAGGERIDEALPEFLREAQHLQELCSRIVASSPAGGAGGGGGAGAGASAAAAGVGAGAADEQQPPPPSAAAQQAALLDDVLGTYGRERSAVFGEGAGSSAVQPAAAAAAAAAVRGGGEEVAVSAAAEASPAAQRPPAT